MKVFQVLWPKFFEFRSTIKYIFPCVERYMLCCKASKIQSELLLSGSIFFLPRASLKSDSHCQWTLCGLMSLSPATGHCLGQRRGEEQWGRALAGIACYSTGAEKAQQVSWKDVELLVHLYVLFNICTSALYETLVLWEAAWHIMSYHPVPEREPSPGRRMLESRY